MLQLLSLLYNFLAMFLSGQTAKGSAYIDIPLGGGGYNLTWNVDILPVGDQPQGSIQVETNIGFVMVTLLSLFETAPLKSSGAQPLSETLAYSAASFTAVMTLTIIRIH